MSSEIASPAFSRFRRFATGFFVCVATLGWWRPSPCAAQAAAGAAAAPANLTGDWTADDGATKYSARLVHAGNRVMGSYDYQGGRIDGTFADGVFSFTWDQPANRRGGQSRLTLAADGKSMTGTWSYDPAIYESGLKAEGKWTFVRAETVPNPGGSVAGPSGGGAPGGGAGGAGVDGPQPNSLLKGDGTAASSLPKGNGTAAAKEMVAKAKPKADASKALVRIDASPVPEPPKVVPFRPQTSQDEVPNVVGQSAKDAKAALAAKGFRAAFEATDEKPPSPERAFTVRTQDPVAGTKVPAGDAAKTLVTLQVYGEFAKPPAQDEVPNVVGQSAKDAKAALAAKGFRAAFEATDEKTPSSEKAFTIRSQSPAAGTRIPAGDAAKTLVTLQVYGAFAGGPPVGAPSLTGRWLCSCNHYWTLKQTGQDVTGSHEEEGRRRDITKGTFDGQTFRFTWTTTDGLKGSGQMVAADTQLTRLNWTMREEKSGKSWSGWIKRAESEKSEPSAQPTSGSGLVIFRAGDSRKVDPSLTDEHVLNNPPGLPVIQGGAVAQGFALLCNTAAETPPTRKVLIIVFPTRDAAMADFADSAKAYKALEETNRRDTLAHPDVWNARLDVDYRPQEIYYRMTRRAIKAPNLPLTNFTRVVVYRDRVSISIYANDPVYDYDFAAQASQYLEKAKALVDLRLPP